MMGAMVGRSVYFFPRRVRPAIFTEPSPAGTYSIVSTRGFGVGTTVRNSMRPSSTLAG
jgi:hypothetical protein